MPVLNSIKALTLKASLIASATCIAATLGVGAAAAGNACVYSNAQKICGPQFAPDGTVFTASYSYSTGAYEQHRDPIYRIKSKPQNIRFCLVNQTGTPKQINLGVADVNTLNAAPRGESCASINIRKNPRVRLSMRDQGNVVDEANFSTNRLGGQRIIFKWTESR